ncbi:aldo-keto reductase family 1 member B1-like isoform X2 [Haliotis asinina]|uniref:aldo-keto reductase family 1 member B1-like isoform X2 n=1 Tax=Haliotis asinina TaxID=109174 RepID=UPI0035323CA5
MADKVPSIRLNSGYDMPMLGLGTYNSFKPNEVGDAVEAAIQMGYRHIDTAWSYTTEPEIGATVKKLIQEGKIKREELFIVTKDAKFTKPTMTDYLDTWRAMEKLVDKGLVRSIGVSNFNKQQLERILKMDGLKYKPTNIQVEMSPYLGQEDLLQFCLKNGISTTGYASFGAPGQDYITKDAPKTLEDPTIVQIGRKYNKSSAQVILRWGIQRGFAVVPKSTNPSRLAQNMDIFGFKLSEEDVKAMLALDRGYRSNAHLFKACKDHPYYPFEK